jgi:uncharacterized protein (TIGR02646 family)
MRWIKKNNEPRELIQWRVSNANDINFGYDLMRQDKDVTKAVTESLVKEQGWLCAYSGIRIKGYEEVEVNGTKYDRCDCHIDHVKAQTYCGFEETVSYTNMVASYPGPNAKHKTPFGGEQKGNWPNYKIGEQALFVSPLDQSCKNRFLFNLKGEIKHKSGDTAAETTIVKLGLNDDELKKLRKGAIQGTLGLKNNLPIKDARNRLRKLQSQNEGILEPFCFVLVQALEKHIERLEYIAASKSKARNKT